MLSVNCNHCNKASAKLKWCWSCKRAAYCNIKCQKKDWKQHKKQCTHSYIKANKDRSPQNIHSADSILFRYTAADQPFKSIPASIFSRNKFTQYLTECNSALIPNFGDIIYSILTGYQTTFNLTHIFPSDILDIVPMKKIEMHFDSGACPVIALANHTFAGYPIALLQALESESKNTNCRECTECLDKLKPIMQGMQQCIANNMPNEESLKEKIMKFCVLSIPRHIKPNWKRYKYGLQIVRDITDDSVSVLLQTLTEHYESMAADEFIRDHQYSLASFRAIDVMPYFDGRHYAYLLKAVLDEYQFGETEYSRIEYVGFSWSVTSDVKLKRKFLRTVHHLLHSNIRPTADFFFCPLH